MLDSSKLGNFISRLININSTEQVHNMDGMSITSYILSALMFIGGLIATHWVALAGILIAAYTAYKNGQHKDQLISESEMRMNLMKRTGRPVEASGSNHGEVN
jgi:hypothetical protein